MTTPKLLELLHNELSESLSQFGKHTFFDKGPFEVMSLGPFVTQLKEMKASDAGDVLVEIRTWPTYGIKLSQSLVGEFELHQHMDDWEEMNHPIFAFGV